MELNPILPFNQSTNISISNLSNSSDYYETYFQPFFYKCKGYIDDVTHVGWFSLFIYIAVTITLLFAVILEYSDTMKVDISSPDKPCVGKGSSFYKGKPSHDDSLNELLQKIRISCRHDVASVYWRRSIIFAIIVGFILLLFVLQRLPTGLEWILTVLILYLSLYFFLNFYQEIISKPACEQVNKATKIIECRYSYDRTYSNSSSSIWD